MAWFDGTMAVSERNLSNQYPIKFFCVNGDYTIRQYREWYLKKKAADPSFASESAGFPTPMDEEEP